MLCLTIRVRVLCLLALVASALAGQSAADEPPKTKSDAEQLTGAWELPIGDAKEKRFIRLTFREAKEGGQFDLVQHTDKQGVVRFSAAAGFSFKVETRGKKKMLILDNCLWLDNKKAEIEYEVVDGKLRLAGGKLSKDAGGHALKGDWPRGVKIELAISP